MPVLEGIKKSADNEEQHRLADQAMDMVQAAAPGAAPGAAPQDSHDLLSLSGRETDIARLISQGCSCRETAELLGVSVRSVQSHCYNIRKKLGLTRNIRLKNYLRPKQTEPGKMSD